MAARGLLQDGRGFADRLQIEAAGVAAAGRAAEAEHLQADLLGRFQAMRAFSERFFTGPYN
jgi:hypothetical protein